MMYERREDKGVCEEARGERGEGRDGVKGAGIRGMGDIRKMGQERKNTKTCFRL